MRYRRLGILSVLFMMCAACAPRALTIGEIVQPANWSGNLWTTTDGHAIATRSWMAENPKAVIIGVHGINDYSQAFADSAPWFAERGIAFYAFDQRGFGNTPEWAAWYDTRSKTHDLDAFYSLVAERHAGAPIYLVGLSMGSAVTLATLANNGPASGAQGAVLVSPAVWGWKTLNPLYKTTLWIGAHTFPRKTLTGSRLKIWPSDNIDMLRAFSRDPLVIKETRIETIYGLVNLMDRGYASAEQISIPTLILYGENDEVVPRKPVFDLIENINSSKRAVVYEKGYHMLTRDLQRERVWLDIAQWIDDQNAPLPSGEEIDLTDNAGLTPSSD